MSTKKKMRLKKIFPYLAFKLGMAIRRISGSNSESYKNPLKKRIFHELRNLEISADLDFRFVLNFTFFRIFRSFFSLFLAPTVVIFSSFLNLT